MADKKPRPLARRVVTGFDEQDRSTIVSDSSSTSRIDRPGGATVTEIWRADSLPADPWDAGPLSADSVLSPTSEGLAVRICTFPPDSEIDQAAHASYATSLAESYGPGSASTDEADPAPGMHQTETVDVVTVISGELRVVLEDGETTLEEGDSLVQRGTAHAWSNRSDKTAVVVAVMMGAAAADGSRPR